VSNGASAFVKHWGRVRLPAELDVQEDPAIHYHLRDLFTGEVYVRAGDELARRGLVVGLERHRVHVLQVEDIRVEDLAVERSLAADRDISEFLRDCTKRVGVVGDVHGELEALQQILRALDFIDAFGHWSARDGTLVFTGDIGHGRHLQEVFDFIHRVAGQAHRVGGRIVWTLGNHDLYVDREGGQGGEDSLGYRLWPSIREAALHPERHPGLTVQAAFFEHGKLFVHGGVLPNIIELAARERGARDAEAVAAYVNDVFRRTLVDRERISARDLPHEIFHIGTSHTLERVMPGEIGYEPAGVFTPDLRELDHYRYHANLLPQVVGHTASRRGEIRYAPGSWLARDYIAIDVGRQHGTGNGGLLLTDFGWVAVNPDGPARLVEVVPLFVELARQAADARTREEHGEAPISHLLGAYFKVARPKQRTTAEVQNGLFADLSPAQRGALERFFATIRETGCSVVVTDLDATLTAFSGANTGKGTLDVITNYLAAGGILVICSDSVFDWFYARFLRPVILALGARSQLLSSLLLILSGGTTIYVFHDGAYRLISNEAGQDRSDAFDVLVELSTKRGIDGMPVLQPADAAYIGDSTAPRAVDPAIARRVELVIDVGDAIPEPPGKPIVGLRRSYQRIMDTFVAATAALQEHGRTAAAPAPREVRATVLWTFDRPHFLRGQRLRVRVGGSGFVHAGVTRADGSWAQVYEVPLMPLPDGRYEAVLPENVDAFTFFWTEAPWTPHHPGHWERRPGPGRVFTASRST